VLRLLEASPAYGSLPAGDQQKLAGDMIGIGVYLAEPEGIRANSLTGAIVAVPAKGTAGGDLLAAVNFPAFVGGLIEGVFQAIVNSSIEQMRAYIDLISSVAKTIDGFASDRTSDEAAQEWLARTYPDCFELDEKTHKVRLRVGVDFARVLPRLRLLPGQRSLSKLAPDEIEKKLVPAVRLRIAATRQQILATMTLMGINRIVVTDVRIRSS
jgi:hypothetical protein